MATGAKIDIHPGERVDFLMKDGMRIIQHPGKFCFGMDAVLLAHFIIADKEDAVLDFGTGVGVIPLLLVGWGKVARVDGLEIQPELSDMARRSVQLNGLEKKIRIITGDLRKAEAYFPKNSYSVVTCNPPYIPLSAGVMSKNEAIAIAKLEVCCTLEDVILNAAKMLRSLGRLAMIYKPARFNEAMFLLQKYKLPPRRIRWVYSSAEENAELVLIDAQKAGKEGLTVLPPLIVYDEKHCYTKEMQEIYKGLTLQESNKNS